MPRQRSLDTRIKETEKKLDTLEKQKKIKELRESLDQSKRKKRR